MSHRNDNGKLKHAGFWGVCENEAQGEFMTHTVKFASEVKDAIKLMSPGQE